MTVHLFFKAVHHHWGECNWLVVAEPGIVGFLGQGNYGGGLQTVWDRDQLKVFVKPTSTVRLMQLWSSGAVSGGVALKQHL